MLPFVALVGIISNGEWWNNKNNDRFSETVKKSVHILSDSLVTIKRNKGKSHVSECSNKWNVILMWLIKLII